jgi:hypothetical protein
VAANDPPLLDRAAYRSMREALGERLRAYYDYAQHIPFSEPLAEVVAQFERGVESDPRC